jgi:hypothetical protein
MVYNKTSIYTLESIKKINMGVFYRNISGNTTECSRVNHRKITWEYENMVDST